MQSLTHTNFAEPSKNISPSTDNGDFSTDTERPTIPERRRNKNGRGKHTNKEPDSGISSTISSTTRPWSQNDTTLETDQVRLKHIL